MKRKAIALLLALAAVAAPAALGDPGRPHGHGPKAHGYCAPAATYRLAGTVVSVGTDSLELHVLAGNALVGQDVTVAVDGSTKIRRRGPADLASLVSGDRVRVRARACETDGPLVATQIHARAAAAADDASATTQP